MSIIKPQSTSHWYSADGQPMYEVPKAKGGGTRKTTIRDARKHGWYPSVTSILKIVDKPFLNAWIANQAIEACIAISQEKAARMLALSKRFEQMLGTEIFEESVKETLALAQELVLSCPALGASDLPRIKEKSDEVSKEAREKGIAYHRAIEKVMFDYAGFSKQDPYGLPQETFERLVEVFKAHNLEPKSLEQSFANERYGYGGRVDFVGYGHIRPGDNRRRLVVLDYKTQNTKGTGKFTTYGEVKCQLAAYAAGIGKATADLGTIFIDTSIDGNVELVYHSDNDQYFIDFLAAFRLWRTETLGKNYEV